jgi:hypothetical protein
MGNEEKDVNNLTGGDMDKMYQDIHKAYENAMDKEHPVHAFLREHKKELQIAGVSAAVSVLLFAKISKRRLDLEPYVHLDAGIRNYEKEHQPYSYGSGNLPIENLKLRDLGKLGKEILKQFPQLDKDMKLNNLSVIYSVPVHK